MKKLQLFRDMRDKKTSTLCLAGGNDPIATSKTESSCLFDFTLMRGRAGIAEGGRPLDVGVPYEYLLICIIKQRTVPMSSSANKCTSDKDIASAHNFSGHP